MPHRTHFDIAMIAKVFNNLCNLPPVKGVIMATTFIFTWLFNGETEILLTIYLLISIDTFLGVWIAGKNKKLSSRGFYRVAVKSVIYFLMVVVGLLVDKYAPLKFASSIINSFLVGTEGFSILENISLLGFPVPTKLLKLMKIYYKE